MIIYGKQVFWHLAKSKPALFEEVYLTKEIKKDEFQKVVKLGVKILRADEKKAQAMAHGGAHQGFLAKVKPIELKSLSEIKKLNFIVVLVGVTDMGNIGSIIRTAYSLGVDGLVLSGTKCFNLELAVKPSAGAIFDLPIAIVTNPLDLINELKLDEFCLYGAVLNGDKSKNLGVQAKKALFMGSEGEGLPNRVVDRLDKKVTIDMKNGFDSLNVAVASAILIDRING